jgi:hypothetical protein
VSTPAPNVRYLGRSVTARRPWGQEHIDDALDGLVATVDGLVRDLGEPDRAEPYAASHAGRAAAALPRTPVLVLVVLAVLAFELLLVSWFMSQL